MKLSDDRHILDLSLSGPHTAQQIETLMAALAETRAKMEPPISFEPPAVDMLADEDLMTIQTDPYVRAGVASDGCLRIFLRHSGFGWVAYDLSAANTLALRDLLVAQVRAHPDKISVLGKHEPKGNGPH